MDTKTVSTGNYRAFRATALEHAQKQRNPRRQWRYQDDPGPESYLSRRERVRLVRDWVSDNLQSLLAQDPATEPHIRRLLGIGATVPLIPEQWSGFRQFGQWFVPLFLTWPHVRSVMLKVRTYEGRAYLFEHLYKRVLACNLDYYTPAIDFALRRLVTPSLQETNDLKMLDPGWVKATYVLGLRKVAQIEPYARYDHRQLDGVFADLLVQTKVIDSVAELEWLDYRLPTNYNSPDLDERTLQMVRKMVGVMLSHGIARQPIAKMFKFSLSYFDPERLASNLDCISAAGVRDVSALFEAVGELLWRAQPATWSYVLNIVGTKDSREILRFTRLLEAHEPPSVTMAQTLIALGADVDGLAQCQRLLLAAERDGRTAPVAELQLLASAPHALNIDQIARCADYLEQSDNLPDYLAVLDQYGFGCAAAVVAFQSCYRNATASTLKNWLDILGNRGAGVQLEAIAEWVRQSSKAGHTDGYQYLIQAIPMPDLKHLQQAEPIIRFGRIFLEYLVVDKGLATIQQLRDWYFKARGVQDIRYWSALDAVSRTVLDDAYVRNNFAFVASNEAAIYGVLQERVQGILGRRPYPADEAILAQYDQRYKATRSAEGAALLPILPTILAQTGGILLRSVLRWAWQPPQALQEQLNALTPIVEGLLSGQGPTGGVPSELEADAISMLYRTSPDTVGRVWSQVKGHEQHLASLTLRSHYLMRWTRSIRRLRQPLERSSLLALAQAKSFAWKFSPYASESISDACKHLRGKRLDDRARDPWSLAAHLGVLFAAASGDSVLDRWISQELDSVVQIVEEGADVALRLEQLDQIFNSTLPDALKVHAATFTHRFSDSDARLLATRLVGSKVPLQGDTGHAQLLAALIKTQDVVLSTCQRWMLREQRKFVKDKTGQNVTVLNAMLSKHPAAYFAKHAANLCTRENVTMWHEERHAHIVVFDTTQRRLAGMALAYVEPIDDLDRSRNCLIIRAINPMDDMLATHSASSIVDAFLDVAIEIAKANDLAAVAFPWHNGVHLLSNQRAIEKDLEKRFTKLSVAYNANRRGGMAKADIETWRERPRSISAEFYAYAHGDEKVSTLYAVWANHVAADTEKDKYASLDA